MGLRVKPAMTGDYLVTPDSIRHPIPAGQTDGIAGQARNDNKIT
jgi:hypothetical protein